MDIVIRPYADADFEAVAVIWFEGWASVDVDPPPGLRAELRERLGRELAQGWSLHVAADPVPVGFAAVFADKLEQLFVPPARQGQGVGRRLLDFVKAERPGGFWLTTPVDNAGAIRFYEREGLNRGEVSAHPRHGHPIVRYDWKPE